MDGTGSFEFLRLERRGPAVVVTLTRPEVMNAFRSEMVAELDAAMVVVEGLPERVVIITGAGEKAFSAGADLQEMLDMDAAATRASLRAGVAMTLRIERSRKVTIAAVNGHALGGGMEVALACDLRTATPRARLGLPETAVGIFPGWGGTVRLPRLVPRGVALELLLTGRPLSGEEAHRVGLVNALADDALAAAVTLAEAVVARAPIAQEQAKQVVGRTAAMALDDALEFENEAWMRTYPTADRREGHRAFLERRDPVWRGE
jgi:enoyl-CoA hydratase/carnithine racemase